MKDRIVRTFAHFFSIRKGTDIGGTTVEINENAGLRGSNIWMLVCSSILASIGLDQNSTAIIIGAMLISPLMSPILGVGFGAAIFDKLLLRKAIRSLAIATLVSLATSTLYFLITPLGILTSELTSRTTPTLLDVGVAFFGGIAGVVAGSRQNKSSAIPGVAIATALMPPICTAGFGIANGNTTVFLGAFYLFFINAFFISLATYLMTKFLGFPTSSELDPSSSVLVKRTVIAGAVLVSIPSVIILFGVIQELRFDRGLKGFIETVVRTDERQALRWQLDRDKSPPILKIYVVGKQFTASELESLEMKMPEYGLGGIKLSFIQLSLPKSELTTLSSNLESDYANRLSIISSVDEQQENEISQLRSELETLRVRTDPDIVAVAELKRRFDFVTDAKWGPGGVESASDGDEVPRKLTVTLNDSVDPARRPSLRTEMEAFIRNRIHDPKITVELVDVKEN